MHRGGLFAVLRDESLPPVSVEMSDCLSRIRTCGGETVVDIALCSHHKQSKSNAPASLV